MRYWSPSFLHYSSLYGYPRWLEKYTKNVKLFCFCFGPEIRHFYGEWADKW
jgi:hypothetical protein